jgi:hypothetical protein
VPLASRSSTSQWQGSGAHQQARSWPASVCSCASSTGCIISQRSYIAMLSSRSVSVALGAKFEWIGERRALEAPPRHRPAAVDRAVRHPVGEVA